MNFFISKAYAAVGSDSVSGTSAFDNLLGKLLNNIVTPIVYFIFALAVVYFLWGMIVFLQNADDAGKREEGKNNMIYGVIGLFIMISARGIISVILSTLGL